MNWPKLPLHRVTSLESGFGFPREHQGDDKQEFPFFRVSDMNLEGNEIFMHNHTNTVSAQTLSELGARAFPPGTVIFPKIGAAIATEKKRILTRPATFDNNVMGAVPDEVLDPKFLYYWFLQLRLSDFANPGHVPSIRKSVMEQIPFELTPPTEQRRIVEILDVADNLRELCRDSDAKATRILPALFLKMFGDPATNPKKWPLMAIRDQVHSIERRNPSLDSEATFHYVDISGVDGWKGEIVEARQLLGRDAPSRARQVIRENDVLISTVRPYLRATALVPANLDNQIASTGFCVLRSKAKFGRGYLYALSRLQWFTEQLNARARGASYPAVTDSDILGLRIPAPTNEGILRDLDRQLDELIHVNHKLVRTTQGLEKLFSMLLNGAFSGGLTAKWRETHASELLAEMEQQAKLLNLPPPNVERLVAET